MIRKFIAPERGIPSLLFCAFFVGIGMMTIAGAAAPQPGDQVSVTKPAPLYFRDSKIRDANAGEKFKVVASKPDKVFVLAKDKQGKDIALSIQMDALAVIPPDPVKLRSGAIAAAKARKFTDAAEFIQQAIRADPQNPEMLETLKAISTAQVASQKVERAKAAQRQIAIEATRKRKNAAVTNRPNPLSPNDSSNQQRAEAMRADADQIEQSGKQAVAEAEVELNAALEVFGNKRVNSSTAAGTLQTPALGTMIVPNPGVELTPAQEAHNRKVQEQETAQMKAQYQNASQAIKRWTDDTATVPEFVSGRSWSPNYEETLQFINRKLEQSGRRLWFGERAQKMILTSGDSVVVFDAALCNPEVGYGTKQEDREHARYPMAGFGLPPVMDRYSVERSQLRIEATNGRQEIQFFYPNGANEKAGKLFLNWEDNIDPEDLKKLANAFSHLIKMFGGKSDPF